ncbi:MAG TPA: type II toxin-antitoxin system VapC family toxin [Acetobacteraceae bacterium]|nr:type II toxin-antitoxin system VapC family toxin [Acetobacteraceae bacterium]
MTIFLVDSNVLLDVTTGNPIWADWSQRQLDDAWRDGQVVINQVIYAEMSLDFASVEALDFQLSALGLVVLEIPREALFLAARVFRAYRRRGGTRAGVLPDFFIGAHAAVEGMTLITRDLRRRGWFPSLQVIAPVS